MILSNIRSSGMNVVFDMYIIRSGNNVLNQQALQEAVEVSCILRV